MRGGGRGGVFANSSSKRGRTANRFTPAAAVDAEDVAASHAKRFAEVEEVDEIDQALGHELVRSSVQPRIGWLLNMQSTFVKDPDWPAGRSALNLYFMQEDGQYFRVCKVSSPYFYVKCKVKQSCLNLHRLERRLRLRSG